jgi:predicted transcriptional regulator
MDDQEVLTLSASMVANYVGSNKLDASQIPDLLRSVNEALRNLGQPELPPAPAKATSAQIRRSIRPEALISFEDGKSYKTLRRHLNLRGLTPDAYRLKWGLPATYPMTAADYAATRSALAKAAGLGQRGRQAKNAGGSKARGKK